MSPQAEGVEEEREPDKQESEIDPAEHEQEPAGGIASQKDELLDLEESTLPKDIRKFMAALKPRWRSGRLRNAVVSDGFVVTLLLLTGLALLPVQAFRRLVRRLDRVTSTPGTT